MSTSFTMKGTANLAEKHIAQASNRIFVSKRHLFSLGKKSKSFLRRAVPSKTHSVGATNTQYNKSATAKAATSSWSQLIPPVPMIASAVYQHYKKGPALKSWNLSTDITVAIVRDFLTRCRKITVEEIQQMSNTKELSIPSYIQGQKFVIPNSYRKRAGDHLVKLFSQTDERYIGWDWESDRENAPPLQGEWLQMKGIASDGAGDSTILYLHGGAYYLGSYGIYRPFLSRIIKHSHASSCAINYRLAPQHPFPAALEDALATYLYLIDPPVDAIRSPTDPKKIVISGDSAGGGLTFALLLAIRDSELPSPAGAMTLSAWLDLSHSLPSLMTNMMTDYLPPTGFKHAPSPALDYHMLSQKISEKISCGNDLGVGNEKPIEMASKTSSNEPTPAPPIDSEDIERVHFYAPNEALKLPLVSPIFDQKNMQNIPRLLVQCGTAERLRDENIYTALKASNCYPGSQPADSHKDNHVTLELYADQPHVFQIMFSNKQVSRAFRNLSAFVCEVTHSPHTVQDIDHHYMNNDPLTVHSINTHGVMVDSKKEFMETISKETWINWENRLARPSIKERVDEVNEAYKRHLEDRSVSHK